ncbi:hypothetical protein ACFQMA_15700 [Halosimplex aquaticum]|uniref:Uncharacterized protein n=1 Tax=Halosimplex aquaticum TaxID=3026162 RepID=A0ABD5Y1P8_9EURY|nr:hypothetical protein [Halosimplex aquaticum]
MPPLRSDISVYDHLRSTGAGPADEGVYRVVGTDDEHVTLLRVGDADGRRVNTGEVLTVDRDALDGFEPTDNPDGNRPAGETVSGFLRDFVWQLRAFAGGLRSRPLASLAALALVVVGHQGHRVLSVPELWLTAVYFLGVLGVVYLGARGG